MFPGVGEIRKGYLYGSGKPGLGVNINEQLAEKNPLGPIRDGGASQLIAPSTEPSSSLNRSKGQIEGCPSLTRQAMGSRFWDLGSLKPIPT